MTAQLAVDHGVTPRAIFSVAIGPRLNRRAQAAFRVYEAELIDADQREPDKVAFVPLTLETVIEAIAKAEPRSWLKRSGRAIATSTGFIACRCKRLPVLKPTRRRRNRKRTIPHRSNQPFRQFAADLPPRTGTARR